MQLLYLGLPILGVFRTFTAVVVDFSIKGVGLATAILATVKAVNFELGDIDLFEINEVLNYGRNTYFVFRNCEYIINQEICNCAGICIPICILS